MLGLELSEFRMGSGRLLCVLDRIQWLFVGIVVIYTVVTGGWGVWNVCLRQD